MDTKLDTYKELFEEIATKERAVIAQESQLTQEEWIELCEQIMVSTPIEEYISPFWLKAKIGENRENLDIQVFSWDFLREAQTTEIIHFDVKTEDVINFKLVFNWTTEKFELAVSGCIKYVRTTRKEALKHLSNLERLALDNFRYYYDMNDENLTNTNVIAMLTLRELTIVAISNLKDFDIKEDEHIYLAQWVIYFPQKVFRSREAKLGKAALMYCLSHLYQEKKIDDYLYFIAFKHHKEKKVIEKFYCNKTEKLPLTWEEFHKWDGIPKELLSYVKKATWRVREKPKKDPLKLAVNLEELDNLSPHELDELNSDALEIARVHEAIESLREEQREVIKLIFWGDLNQADCARRLNLSRQSIKERYDRAIVNLRKFFSQN